MPVDSGVVDLAHYVDKCFEAWHKQFGEYKAAQVRAQELFERTHELEHSHIEERLIPLVTEKERHQGATSRSNWLSVIALAFALVDLILRLLGK